MFSLRQRVDVRRLATLVVLTVAMVVFLATLPSALRSVWDLTRTQRAMPVSDRRLAAAFNYDVSRAFVLQAQQLLPPGGRYAFRTGPNASASMPVTVTAAPFVNRYLLLPRLETSLADADWLLCYGCDLSSVPARTEVVWREPDATGLLIARVRR